MHLEEQIKDGIAVVALKGDLLYEEDGTLLTRKVESLSADDINRIVLDCSNLNNINSEGLASLLALAKSIRTRGGDIKIAAVDGHLESILAMTRLVRIFDTYETVGRALASYAH